MARISTLKTEGLQCVTNTAHGEILEGDDGTPRIYVSTTYVHWGTSAVSEQVEGDCHVHAKIRTSGHLGTPPR